MKFPFKSVLASLFGAASAGGGAALAQNSDSNFPPAPSWQPAFTQPLDQVSERCHFYFNKAVDMVVFANGTCVTVQNGQTEDDAFEEATEVLGKIIGFHPDMSPLQMKDGNVFVQYNHPAYNVVLKSIFEKNRSSFHEDHLKGLTPDEVIITPDGSNKFDEFGMQALYGRSLMFLDALEPKFSTLLRAEVENTDKAKE